MNRFHFRPLLDTIRRTLERERYMRDRVFSRDPAKRAQKVGEIDRALEALAEIEGQVAPRENQTDLFDGGAHA